MRRAVTLVDLALALTLSSLAAAIAVPRVGRLADALRVRGAADDLTSALALARQAALARGALATLGADTVLGRVWVECGGDTLARRAVADSWGVRLSATRTTVRFAPTGLGYGAANTTLVVRRGLTSDTVVVSRLGRVLVR